MTEPLDSPVLMEPGEIRQIFQRHPGTITALADELGVTTQAISGYLAGKPRKNVQRRAKRLVSAVQAKARELLGLEQLIKEHKAS